MKRRQGMISFMLILIFSSLIAVTGAALMYVGNIREREIMARSSLSAQYAAESGANLALAKVRAHEPKQETIRLVLHGSAAIVRIKNIKKENGGVTGQIYATGRDVKNGRERYLRLYFKKDGQGQVHITRIGSSQ